MKDIRGSVALLTGASGGIGRAIAEQLAREGVALVLSGRREDALAETARAVEALGGRSAVVPADLGDVASIATLAQKAEAALGPIDILVNNAGIDTGGRFASSPPEELRSSIEVNLTAPMLLTRELVPGMADRGRGHVVFVASAAGKFGPAYVPAYAATKAGLIGLTQSLRGEYARSPVGFSVVCPGFVMGDGMYQRIEDDGFGAPRLLGRTTTDAVSRSVVKAITGDRPETLPTGAPFRPILVLSQAAPRLAERLVGVVGVHRAFAARAAAEDEQRAGESTGT